ncbi:MAG TPA: amino acid permease [Candidatus Thermoplasmatota archaeon]|nr:amino acid permease [Candidatus Thermoplasmatota archaeon]
MELRRELGLAGAVALCVGTMVGSGIFFGPQQVARELGDASLVLLAWVVAGLLALAGALVFAEYASAIPSSGGASYTFLAAAWPRPLAFLGGWTALVASYGGGVAAVSVAFASFAVRLAGHDPLARPMSVAAIAIALLYFLAFVNWQGLRHGSRVQGAATALKVAAVAALAAGGLWAAAAVESDAPAAPAEAAHLTPLVFLAALVVPIFAYSGYIAAAQMGDEVRDPRRTLPRALVLGPLAVIGLYLLVNVAYLAVLGSAGLANSSLPGYELATASLGEHGGTALALAVLVSTFGTTNAILMAAPRVAFALAREGLFPPALADVGARGTPGPAIALVAGAGMALVAAGLALRPVLGRPLFEFLVMVEVFAPGLFAVLIGVGLLRLRRARPDLPRPFRVPLYPVLPLAWAGTMVAVAVALVAQRPVEAGIGAAIVTSGLPVYAWMTREPRRPARPQAVAAPA